MSDDRLARLLGTTPEDIAALGLDDAQRDALSEHVADAWHERDTKTLTAVLSLLGVLPDPLVAKVAQKRMPPRFIARVAPHLDGDAAGGLVGRLKPEYLAEVAQWLDHPRCGSVLRAIPRESIERVATVLVERDDWDTLAAVGRELDDDALTASLHVLPRDRVLADVEGRDAAHRERVLALLG